MLRSATLLLNFLADRLGYEHRLRYEQGQGLAEYVLIIFLFSIAMIIAIGAFGATLQTTYGTIAAAIASTLQ